MWYLAFILRSYTIVNCSQISCRGLTLSPTCTSSDNKLSSHHCESREMPLSKISQEKPDYNGDIEYWDTWKMVISAAGHWEHCSPCLIYFTWTNIRYHVFSPHSSHCTYTLYSCKATSEWITWIHSYFSVRFQRTIPTFFFRPQFLMLPMRSQPRQFKRFTIDWAIAICVCKCGPAGPWPCHTCHEEIKSILTQLVEMLHLERVLLSHLVRLWKVVSKVNIDTQAPCKTICVKQKS